MISLPIQYVFDWEMKTTPKRTEIETILDIMTEKESVAQSFGLEPDGYGFQNTKRNSSRCRRRTF